MNVDRALVDLRGLPPDAVEQLRAREDAARLFQKIFEETVEKEMAQLEHHVRNVATLDELQRMEWAKRKKGDFERHGAEKVNWDRANEAINQGKARIKQAKEMIVECERRIGA